ncbi:MAG: hypothetical protein P8M30_09835 [Planctomycetaceae bacterium]|jgi:hypothetical protein|nr:hypothetical protein [Planctomycetaceae bacterium]
MAAKPVSNRKLIAGGIIVAAAGAILSMVGGLFPGFGNGTGNGDGTSDIEINSASDNSPSNLTTSSNATSTQGILDIVIDGESYLVAQQDGKRSPMTLSEISSAAPKMTGNEDEILVQVSRKRSSLFSAERALEETFRESELEESQIRWVQEVVD